MISFESLETHESVREAACKTEKKRKLPRAFQSKYTLRNKSTRRGRRPFLVKMSIPKFCWGQETVTLLEGLFENEGFYEMFLYEC